MAPGRDPRPPTMITARPLSSMLVPIEIWALLTLRANNTPATPPRAEDSAKVSAVIRSTSIPRTRAACGFSATARIPRPSLDRETISVSPTMSANATATMTSWSTETVEPANSIRCCGKASGGNRRVSGPKPAWSRARKIAPRKIPLRSCCIRVLLQDGELAALHDLYDGRSVRVAGGRHGELAERRGHVLELGEVLLDVLTLAGAAGAHCGVHELEPGVGLRGELVGVGGVLCAIGRQERLVLRSGRRRVPRGTDDHPVG